MLDLELPRRPAAATRARRARWLAALGLLAMVVSCSGKKANPGPAAGSGPTVGSGPATTPPPAMAAPTPSVATPRSPQFWWPEQLDLSPLRQRNAASNPLGPSFDYAKAFATLDLAQVKRDILATLTTSQDWWPADYGNYGPFFIRMAWHSAGSYRAADGRGGAGGGQMRFDPRNSWPDNANLDKARRLLWPVKQLYGAKLSWGDLMVLAGNVALEGMGFETLGFAGGRPDDWEPDLVFWGKHKEFLASLRGPDGKLAKPLAAVQMGLIYVNPEGPDGKPDPAASAKDIREAFGRMSMDDEETVALIAGGHTFGKAHGAHKPADCVGAEPAAAGVEDQGFGWKNKCGKGHGADTVTSGLEGAWTVNPVAFTTNYLDNLMNFEWVQTKSPGGATQWIPSDPKAATLVPDAHDPSKRHAPIMLTTDLALKVDPAYREVVTRFQKDPALFKQAFARAWFKLTHRDMGPKARYLGPDVPAVEFPWQDPLPAVTHRLIDARDAKALKQQILAAGLTAPQLVRAAWASASTFRGSDMRGGANGARVRLAPQKDWAANSPAELATVLAALTTIADTFNQAKPGGKQVSLADLIVLAGNAGIEQAAAAAGVTLEVPFRPGRTDATEAQTDAASFAVLEPHADGFRNYYNAELADLSPAEALVDKANLLKLTVPEMTVLLGGLRALGANANGVTHGVFTATPGVLSNDFFVNLLDMSTRWTATATAGVYEGRDRKTDAVRWTATPVDLIFGSNSELRAIAEVYAQIDGKDRFYRDFVAAWAKVSELDRFDLAR
jgi:catalase-peroxidase